jgi:hypothetical protein
MEPLGMPGIPREVAKHSLDILLTPELCNNGCGASTKSSTEQSEWSCGSSSRPDSSRMSFTLRG